MSDHSPPLDRTEATVALISAYIDFKAAVSVALKSTGSLKPLPSVMANLCAIRPDQESVSFALEMEAWTAALAITAPQARQALPEKAFADLTLRSAVPSNESCVRTLAMIVLSSMNRLERNRNVQ